MGDYKKKTLATIAILLGLATAALAGSFSCPNPYHPFATCYSDGQTRIVQGVTFEHYTCTCGDKYWVRQ